MPVMAESTLQISLIIEMSWNSITDCSRFVWLVPKWSFESDNAVSGVRIIIQGDSDGSFKDLAKGAGGKFRYLRLERGGGEKITDIRLLRRDDEVSWDTVKSLGFDGISSDINDGRGKSFLYLVWKSN
ncbi:uncharacterized protein LDX57_001164 [Aspergillus melleus]|uniref:uncharacterized protein n=1 Tax=Aspergillus melleus TaxID=138277 RepID=UPI001E8E573F|nr:uncharacterized protein LDX57_001164 [Aspergillus melleus]KAH8423405.1 hypothetical protein LDX57_001164 [Aspergillus melleus]